LVLERCTVPAKYNYVGGTPKQDEMEIVDEDDLYANLPFGAAKLEGRLKRSGKLSLREACLHGGRLACTYPWMTRRTWCASGSTC
jgi:hypothetical protein